MALVNFTCDGINTQIPCLKEDKMKDICNKYIEKINKNIDSLSFLYLGKKINFELTFYEQANSLDNQRQEMNILVSIINEEDSNESILYNNFDIKNKKRFLKIKYHKKSIYCSTLLNDGRFATCSYDKSIIIYNKITFKPDITINEHTGSVNYILALKSGLLASCSNDFTIKIYNIKRNNYTVLQTLNDHNEWVQKIIELRNGKLVSCADDNSFIIYSKDDNNKYKKELQVNVGELCQNIIQTKENELCYLKYNNHIIGFFDLISRKTTNTISDYRLWDHTYFYMITEYLLLVSGNNKFFLINVNQHEIIRTIDDPGSEIFSCLHLNRNMILTGDYKGRIKQWKIEGDNLKLISTKENAQEHCVSSLMKLGNGFILSCCFENGGVTIWQ